MSTSVILGVVAVALVLIVLYAVAKIVKGLLKWALLLILILGAVVFYRSGKWKEFLPADDTSQADPISRLDSPSSIHAGVAGPQS